MNTGIQIYLATQLLSRYGIDNDMIDVSQIVDPYLTWRENKKELLKVIQSNGIDISGEEDLEELNNINTDEIDKEFRETLITNGDLSAYVAKQWLEVIEHPSCVMVTGARGEGKSALGFFLLELFHKETGLDVYSLGLPEKKFELLPEFITGLVNIADIPENSISLIDESSIRFHAYKWQSKQTEIMDMLMLSSRHKNQTYIFATHTARKFAAILLLDMDTVIMKSPSILHSRMERAETKELTKIAKKHFDKIDASERCKYAYVFGKTFEGMLENPIPTFWSDELSRSYAGIPLTSESIQSIDDDNAESSCENEMVKLCKKKPEYISILERIVDFEENNADKKRADRFDDTGKSDAVWEWTDVKVNPIRIRQLIYNGIVELVWGSNRTKIYKLTNREKVEEMLEKVKK